jgi:putative nucleotidyltransferase with HDIG domain
MALTTPRDASAAIRQRFIAVQLDSLRVDKILDFDLYIFTGQEYVLYRSKSLTFTEASRAKLLENKVEKIFILEGDRRAYQKYIEENLAEVLADPQIPEVKKAGILYDCSKNLIQDVFENPTYPENIRRSQDLAESTVGYILKGREAFLSLMRISSLDYYTYTHSVNVTSYAVALARQLGLVEFRTLVELGTGALLHDVGKSRISERILNKRSALNRAELDIVRKHPGWGVEMLRQTELLPRESYHPVYEHHERYDGSGYPLGRPGKEQHLFSRIVAICDVFDALTTERVYQGAMDSYPALKLMHSMRGLFDTKVLTQFTVLLGPDCEDNIY